MDTLQEQLERVREAIAAIETGAQEYQIGNRRLSKASLATLYAREAALKTEIAKLAGEDLYFAQLGRL